jgi:NAD(P)H-hydrate epimerase
MTKGGTGDILAGLIASLYCKNDDPFLVASSGSFLNKKAGEKLFEKVGFYFNSSDLTDEIPRVMKEYIL